MSRARLEIGEHGEIQTSPQRKIDGRWRTVPGNETRLAERWRARAGYRGLDGVLGDLTRVARTRRDAVAALEEALRETLSGSGQADLNARSNFVAACREWLVQVDRQDSGLAASTRGAYRSTVDRYIDSPGSAIRGLSVAQVNTPARIRLFLQGIADDRGTATARTCKTVISSVLDWCLNDGIVTTNAARQIRPVKAETPRTRTRPRDTSRALTRPERDAVLALADQQAADNSLDPRTARKRAAVADLIAFMAGTGARIGEARGLRWEHVQLPEAYVRLHGTKSRSARRRLDLPSWLTERLTMRRAALADSYLASARNAKRTDTKARAEVVAQMHREAELVGEAGYVFPSPSHIDGERPWDQSNSSNAVREVLDAAGLEWATSHSFRRTVATRLGEAGVPLAQIADQLGHADPSMTASVYLGRDFEGDKSALAAHL